MKTHLNTLFVTTQGAYLCKQGQTIAVRVGKETKLRLPLHNLEGIVGFGRVSLSPQLMAACAEQGLSISLLSESGRFRAAITGYTPGNVLLRRRQYQIADDDQLAASAARSIVIGKLMNCRSVLLRAARDSSNTETSDRLQHVANRLSANVHDVRIAQSLERIRGLEGEAAVTYFSAFNDLLTNEDSAFQYTKRTKRPPMDSLNCLLSFMYTLVAHDARSACESAGLDAAVGVLHRDRPGRPGMALDLMEEFRPFLADRLVLSLINRRQVSSSGFQKLETGAVLMNDVTRKEVLVAYQERKRDELRHPFLDEKVSVGMLLHLQARLMARWIRGDIGAYPPFIWK